MDAPGAGMPPGSTWNSTLPKGVLIWTGVCGIRANVRAQPRRFAASAGVPCWTPAAALSGQQVRKPLALSKHEFMTSNLWLRGALYPGRGERLLYLEIDGVE